MKLSRPKAWIVIVLLFFAFVIYGMTRPKRGETTSSFDPGFHGLYVLTSFLKDKDVEVVQWRKSFQKLTGETKIFLVAEDGMAFQGYSKKEREALRDWISRGGHFVLLGTPRPKEKSLLTEFGFSSSKVETQNFLEERLALSRLQFDPASIRQITRVAEFSGNLSCVRSGYEYLSRPDRALKESNRQFKPLIRRGKELLGVEFRQGKGRVTLLSDSFLFSNLGLRIKENAHLASCLLLTWFEDAGQKQLVIDEYHHGYRDSQLLSAYGEQKSFRALAFHLLFLSLFSVWGMGKRFGHAVYAFRKPARRSVEFIDSLGELYFRAGLRKEASSRMIQTLRKRLCKISGSPQNTDLASLSRTAERVFGRDDVVKFIEDHERILQREREYPRKRFLRFQQLIHMLLTKT